ncbi:MAG: hypothetical protein WBB25_19920, partial [Sulfitobacter sp.]
LSRFTEPFQSELVARPLSVNFISRPFFDDQTDRDLHAAETPDFRRVRPTQVTSPHDPSVAGPVHPRRFGRSGRDANAGPAQHDAGD